MPRIDATTASTCSLAIAAIAALATPALTAHAEDAVQWRVQDGGNGHWYDVRSQLLSWQSAFSAAEADGGHLATIADSAENDLIVELRDATPHGGCWIGLRQAPGSAEPDQGWEWITGEPVTYTNWRSESNQPSDSGSSNSADDYEYVEICCSSSDWGDWAGGSPIHTYAVEWSADCNGDGIVDYGQILDGTFNDADGNGVPDCCDDGTCPPPVQWRVEDGGNGHWYSVVSRSYAEYDWNQTRIQVMVEDGGDLADFQTEAEWLFVASILSQVSEPQLLTGGRRSAGGDDPQAGWFWLDATPFSFQAWADGVPNNSTSQELRLVVGTPGGEAAWDDWRVVDYSNGYIIEWSADCNDDGIIDYGQIRAGTLADEDQNNIPDCCDQTTCTPATQWLVEDGGNGRWYQPITIEGTWTDARIRAEQIGANLASVTGPEKTAMLNQLMLGWDWAYVGGLKIDDEWTWLNGDTWDYEVWVPGNPGSGTNAIELRNLGDINDIDADTTYEPVYRALVEWSADCNGDGIVDYGQILDGTFSDDDSNGVPDCCDDATCLAPFQWRAEDGGNGHWYAFKPGYIPWSETRVAAESLGGYLCCMETVEEWDWLRTSMLEPLSSQLFTVNGWGVFIGGVQTDLNMEPKGGWEWLTGVPFECNEDFDCIMENYGGSQNNLALVRNSGSPIQFNDMDDSPSQPFYMVEWSADCNDDGLVDYGQILDGSQTDTDGDGLLDVCEHPGGSDEILDVPSEYATIQDAVEAARDGDRILLMPGTYSIESGDSIATINGKSVRIGGVAGEEANTTLDGQNARRGILFTGAETSSSTIENLTFINGYAENGGGIRCTNSASPLIRNCVFEGNEATSDGGGVQNNTQSSPTIEDCTFRLNLAGSGGGGLNNLDDSNPTVRNCVFELNTADTGGAVANSSSSDPIYDGCVFSENTSVAENNPAAGGMYSNTGSVPTLTNTRICSNTPNQISGDWIDDGGNCITDVCDTDGDEIFDCLDPCPNWPYDCSEDGQTITVAVGQPIQTAIDAVPDGGTVLIDAGTHEEGSPLNTSGKTVTIRGSVDDDGVPATILDGQNTHQIMLCQNGEGAETIFENLTFFRGRAEAETSGGGAMQIIDSSPTIRNCHFQSNVSNLQEGGAILHDDGSPTLIDCVFEDNRAVARDGGAISSNGFMTLSGCLFSSNQSTNGSDGGAIYFEYGLGTVSSCVFSNNEAGRGGGIYFSSVNSGTVMSNTVLCGNTPESVIGTYEDGGGNCISEVCDSDGDDTLDCNDGCPDDPNKTDPGDCGCGVEDLDTDGDGTADCLDPCPNWPYDCSEDGQTIYVAVDQSIQDAIDVVPDGGVVSISQGIFTPESTIDLGGKSLTIIGAVDGEDGPATTLDGLGERRIMQAMSITGNAGATIENLIFVNGSADDGAGLYLNAENATVSNCRFSQCDASLQGGGIYVDVAMVEILECEFIGNSAGDDGGAIAKFPEQGELTIEGCVFSENTAADSGGALYNNAPLDVQSSEFDSNQSSYGGAFRSNTSTVGFSNCQFTGNVAHVRGGAIHANATAEITIDSSSFTGNSSGDDGGAIDIFSSTGSLIATGCTFTNNASGGDGGAACFSAAGATILLAESSFTGNDAVEGGAIFTREASEITISDCTFVSNNATLNPNAGGGGAIYLTNDSNASIQQTTFESNAASYGGAIISSRGFPVLIDCTFTSNTADLDGGAVYGNVQSLSNLQGCDFETNQAGRDGGAVHVIAGSDLELSGCTLVSNSAGEEGGGIYAANSDLLVTDSTFSGNQATFSGGLGVRTSQNVTVRDSIFDGNIALGSSGAAEIWQVTTASFTGCTVVNNMAQGTNGGWGIGSGLRFNNIATSALVDSCVIQDNVALGDGVHETLGGGILVDSGASGVAIDLVDSTLCGNSPDQISGNFTDLGGNCITEVCDSDDDGVLDCNDLCPGEDDLLDTDDDGIADCLDPCPNWPYDCSEDGQTIFVAVGQSIQNALYAIPEGGTVEIAAGSFAIDGEFGLLAGVDDFSLRGAVNAQGEPATILDAEGDGRLLGIDFGQTRATEIENIAFINGERLSGGGAVGISNGSDPLFRNCRFDDSRTEQNGGAVLVTNASATFLDCSFTANQTAIPGAGGAIHVVDGTIEVRNCRFDSNRSEGGGAIGFEDSTGNEMIDSIFTGNEADRGGAIYLQQSELTVSRSDFTLNTGTLAGSAIDVWISQLEIMDVLVCSNGPAEQITGEYVDLGDNCITDECSGDPDICTCLGDFDGDGMVGGSDLGAWLAYAGQPCEPGDSCPGDLDGDGEVRGSDLGILLSNWGFCP